MSKYAHKPSKQNAREFVGITPITTKDLRGTTHVCSCGKIAVCEKAGKTVCRPCADLLIGREFPLRTGRWHRGTSDTQLRDQLEMINQSKAY